MAPHLIFSLDVKPVYMVTLALGFQHVRIESHHFPRVIISLRLLPTNEGEILHASDSVSTLIIYSNSFEIGTKCLYRNARWKTVSHVKS